MAHSHVSTGHRSSTYSLGSNVPIYVPGPTRTVGTYTIESDTTYIPPKVGKPVAVNAAGKLVPWNEEDSETHIVVCVDGQLVLRPCKPTLLGFVVHETIGMSVGNTTSITQCDFAIEFV